MATNLKARNLSIAQDRKPSTAPGEEGLLMLIRQHLWKYLGYIITQIFTASVDLGYHPRRCRSAQIMALRKPGKPDYSQPGAYRPISPLNTLGKLLDTMIARRLCFYAEYHRLLPNTKFGGDQGGQPSRSFLCLRTQLINPGIKKTS